MSDVKMLIYENGPIAGIFVIERLDEKALYKKKLEITVNTFLQKYEMELEENYTNVHLFKNFNQNIEEILEIPREIIQKYCPDCDLHLKCECLYFYLDQKLNPI